MDERGTEEKLDHATINSLEILQTQLTKVGKDIRAKKGRVRCGAGTGDEKGKINWEKGGTCCAFLFFLKKEVSYVSLLGEHISNMYSCESIGR